MPRRHCVTSGASARATEKRRRDARRIVHRALVDVVAVDMRAQHHPLVDLARHVEKQCARLGRPFHSLDPHGHARPAGHCAGETASRSRGAIPAAGMPASPSPRPDEARDEPARDRSCDEGNQAAPASRRHVIFAAAMHRARDKHKLVAHKRDTPPRDQRDVPQIPRAFHDRGRRPRRSSRRLASQRFAPADGMPQACRPQASAPPWTPRQPM